MSETTQIHQPDAGRTQLLQAYGYMVAWILLSAGVILLNKYILDPTLGGFPYPLALTCTHMAFCSVLSWVFVSSGTVEAKPIDSDTYIRSVLPVGGLFALTLWLGNAAYLYLNVSFIQMLKACMPLLVYLVGAAFGTEQLHCKTLLNLLVVVLGILMASYGELHFVVLGVALQIASIFTESIRLTLVQILLQAKGVKLNPITTMYHIAPVCFVCLIVPFAFWEAESLVTHGVTVGAGVLLASAASAFALNVSIFLLIGKTSALTMNVAGVVKDWLLIGLSCILYGSVVTTMQLVGYSIALAGVFYYNYNKVKSMQLAVRSTASSQDTKQ
eukprot:jgi/Chrzof1/1781/Cz10g20260.t1